FGGVAVSQLDVLVGHAQLVGDDLRKGRFVTLSVRMGSCVDKDRAGRCDPYLRRLDQRDAAGRGRGGGAGAESAELDPGRGDGAQVATLLAKVGLLFAQRVITDQLERAIERFVVVTRVDDQPEVLRVRK